MLPSEILSKAADLIEPEGAWTQGAYSKDRRGNPCPLSLRSVCWCAEGAIAAISRADHEVTHNALTFLRKQIGTRASIAWNDAPERTQAEVVSALRKSASLAKEQEHSDAL
jgi:hypothetical protein